MIMRGITLLPILFVSLMLVTPVRAEYVCQCEGYEGRDYCYLNYDPVRINKETGGGLVANEISVYGESEKIVQQTGYNDFIAGNYQSRSYCSSPPNELSTTSCIEEYDRGWYWAQRDDYLNDDTLNRNISAATDDVLREYNYEDMGWICGSEPTVVTAGGDENTISQSSSGGMDEPVPLANPLARTNEQGETYNPSITQIVGEAIQVVLGIVGSISLVVLIYGAFLWLISAGNEEMVKRGTKTMMFAAIGLFIIFSSYAILSMILSVLETSGG